MGFISIQRKTKKEQRFTPNMGVLETKVTYIKRLLFGVPVKTLHKYRETYYGKVKACEECVLEN